MSNLVSSNKGFQISARTLLHLGAELISSDSIALYELIKNAYDANSPDVKVAVEVGLTKRNLHDYERRIGLWLAQSPSGRVEEEDFVRTIAIDASSRIAPAFPQASALSSRLAIVQTINDLRSALRDASTISVADSGTGMSLSDLESVFLTIGTRSKLIERTQRHDTDRPLLGEKGIGRLSAMRLGHLLEVESSRSNESNWNHLSIDWSAFSHDSNAMLSDVDIAPELGPAKANANQSGTVITVRDLKSSWDLDRLRTIAVEQFAKINDPFEATIKRFPLALTFNGEVIPVPALSKLLLDHAHAHVSGHFQATANEGFNLAGEMRYGETTDVFRFANEHLLSLAGETSEVLASLGPFKFEFYWFNRRYLTALDAIGTQSDVRQLLSRWSGGLLLYRDGFRVLPYGESDDDWLDLDRKALSRGGFKVNRAQLVGRVNISSRANPELMDQSNREGLRDSDEKTAFIAMLYHVVTTVFYDFLRTVDKERKKTQPAEPVQIAEVESRLETEEQRLGVNLRYLLENVPGLAAENEAISEIRSGFENVRKIAAEIRELAAAYDEGRSQLLNLAGVGLTVEIVAHEINRAASHALDTLTHVSPGGSGANAEITLRNLKVQLQTLQKRLRILDPLSTAGRNRKEDFDVVELVQDVIASHSIHFERERVRVELNVLPHQHSKMHLKAVRGMIVQVLENLISNSIYWLRHRRVLRPDHDAVISIDIDTRSREIYFRDNGPGIPAQQASKVFNAFFTTKPGGQGKGLGLFIAREIARYHGAELTLAGELNGSDGLNTFILDIGNVR